MRWDEIGWDRMGWNGMDSMGWGVCCVRLVCSGRLIKFASEVVLMSWQVGGQIQVTNGSCNARQSQRDGLPFT